MLYEICHQQSYVNSLVPKRKFNPMFKVLFAKLNGSSCHIYHNASINFYFVESGSPFLFSFSGEEVKEGGCREIYDNNI